MLTINNSQMKAMATASPGQQMIAPCAEQSSWIEFRLVDSDGNPVPGEKYSIHLPDSSLMEGVLDDEGKVRFDSIVVGQASVTFPDIDAGEWKPA
jgi:hypothetical protein